VVAPIAWRRHDQDVPVSQGDLLLVGWGKTIAPAEVTRAKIGSPVIGMRDSFDLRYWDGAVSPVREAWGRMNYSLAVVVAQDCAIDKEYEILMERYLTEMTPEQASARAQLEAEPYVTVAEAWPVSSLPAHVQAEAQSGALGFVPFTLGELQPADARIYVVELTKLSAVSWRAIDHRIGIGDASWQLRLQVALCKFFAARSIRVGEDLESLFARPVVRVETLTPAAGKPPKQRARFHFDDGRSAVLEAIVEVEIAQPIADTARPGLVTQTDKEQERKDEASSKGESG
jgi:hypothetical protein